MWASDDLRKNCARNWTTCDKVADVAFNALTYSADMLLPVIDLKQRSTWIALPGWTRGLTWVENVLGSVCVLLLGAILSGLVKRD